LPPVHLNKPLTNLTRRQYKLSTIVSAKLYRQLCEGNEEREFVGRGEIAFREHTLNIREKAKLVLGRWDRRMRHAAGYRWDQ
jgi:hypothetical protein